MLREIRAAQSSTTITVYQAYPSSIANRALVAGTFVAPFSRDRMTWIKPSFLWMAHRSGWASKPGQERVLAVEISRVGFQWALEHSCLSHFDPRVHERREEWEFLVRAMPTRVQWDPDRDIKLNRMDRRAIQVGLSGEAVARYVDEWIVCLSDLTSLFHQVGKLASRHQFDAAQSLLPIESPVDIRPDVAQRIGACLTDHDR
jgi:hypothetical protein